MKKIAFVIPMILLMAVSVIALQEKFSYRGQEGTVYYIGTDYPIPSSDIKFSAWHSKTQGQGSIQVVAYNLAKERIVLNINFKETEVLYQSDTYVLIRATGTGTYWKKGSIDKTSEFQIIYVIDLTRNIAAINGIGEVQFYITEIKVNQV